MSSYDLIFSNRPSYLISRHAMFWLCCLLLMYSTFWLPTLSREVAPFFSDWNTKELLQRIEKKGWYASFVSPFFDRWYTSFLGQMAFAYIIIYVAIPGYLSGKKNKTTTTIITALLIAAFLIYQYFQLYIANIKGFKSGERPSMPDHWQLLRFMQPKNVPHVTL